MQHVVVISGIDNVTPRRRTSVENPGVIRRSPTRSAIADFCQFADDVFYEAGDSWTPSSASRKSTTDTSYTPTSKDKGSFKKSHYNWIILLTKSQLTSDQQKQQGKVKFQEHREYEFRRLNFEMAKCLEILVVFGTKKMRQMQSYQRRLALSQHSLSIYREENWHRHIVIWYIWRRHWIKIW